MIAIDDNGNFVTASGSLSTVDKHEPQAYKAECRCFQGQYEIDPLYGLNTLVWQLSQSVNDRIGDLYRVGYKYLSVNSITFKDGVYIIT